MSTPIGIDLELVDNWTGALDFQLLADGQPVIVSSSNGEVVSLVLRTRLGSPVTPGGTVSLLASSTGGVRYTPSSSDFLAANSPYRARFKVTDGAGRIVYFPNGEPQTWLVRSL